MNKKKAGFLIVTLFLSSLILASNLAQASDPAPTGSSPIYLPIVSRATSPYWIRHYGTPDEEIARSAFTTQDGSTVLLINQGPSSPTTTFVILKISPDGEIIWQKGYGTDIVSPLFQINGQETSDGGFIISGGGYSGTNSAIVMKLDSSGDIVWQRHFGGENLDYANSILELADGSFVFTGYTASYGSGISDLWLVKLNPAGTTLWQKTVNVDFYQYGNALKQTSDGGFIAAGGTAGGSGLFDFFIVKFDSSGGVTWQKKYGGIEQDYAQDISQTADGGYIVVGATESLGRGKEDAWIIKLNGSGDIVWQKSIGGVLDDRFNAITPTIDGRYIIAGETQSYGVWGSEDTWLVKIDGSGNLLWQKTYGDIRDETGLSIEQLPNGTLLVAGETKTFGGAGREAFLLKLDQNGSLPNCDIIDVPPMVFISTAVSGSAVTETTENSQANAVNSAVTVVSPGLQMGVVCSGD